MNRHVITINSHVTSRTAVTSGGFYVLLKPVDD